MNGILNKKHIIIKKKRVLLKEIILNDNSMQRINKVRNPNRLQKKENFRLPQSVQLQINKGEEGKNTEEKDLKIIFFVELREDVKEIKKANKEK